MGERRKADDMTQESKVQIRRENRTAEERTADETREFNQTQGLETTEARASSSSPPTPRRTRQLEGNRQRTIPPQIRLPRDSANAKELAQPRI